MAHQIESNTDMFSVREVPWHGLGVIVQDAPNSREAIKLAGLDWQVVQENVCREDGRKVEPYLFNVRQDTGKVLGIVSKRYHVFQNEEAFNFADDLIATGDVRYETAGCLKGGERVWVLARLPERIILDDEVETYLCFTHGHNGLFPVKAAITPIRVVCNNTLSVGLENAVRMWSMKHYGNIYGRVNEARLTLGLVDDYMNQLDKLANELVMKKFTDDQAQGFVEKLFPLDEETASPRTVENAMRQREDVIRRYKNSSDLANFYKTGWGLFGAVSEFDTHSAPLRKVKNFKERRFEKIVDGKVLLNSAAEILKAA